MPDDLADEVCRRLTGDADGPADVAGVGALYRAWCERIPFDSIGKALALQEGSTPPGGTPAVAAEPVVAVPPPAAAPGGAAGAEAPSAQQQPAPRRP